MIMMTTKRGKWEEERRISFSKDEKAPHYSFVPYLSYG
jgi:hypothetical protein